MSPFDLAGWQHCLWWWWGLGVHINAHPHIVPHFAAVIHVCKAMRLVHMPSTCTAQQQNVTDDDVHSGLSAGLQEDTRKCCARQSAQGHRGYPSVCAKQPRHSRRVPSIAAAVTAGRPCTCSAQFCPTDSIAPRCCCLCLAHLTCCRSPIKVSLGLVLGPDVAAMPVRAASAPALCIVGCRQSGTTQAMAIAS